MNEKQTATSFNEYHFCQNARPVKKGIMLTVEVARAKRVRGEVAHDRLHSKPCAHRRALPVLQMDPDLFRGSAEAHAARAQQAIDTHVRRAHHKKTLINGR